MGRFYNLYKNKKIKNNNILDIKSIVQKLIDTMLKV